MGGKGGRREMGSVRVHLSSVSEELPLAASVKRLLSNIYEACVVFACARVRCVCL